MFLTASVVTVVTSLLSETDPYKFGESVGEIVAYVLILVLGIYVIYRIIRKVQGKPAMRVFSKNDGGSPYSNQRSEKRNRKSKHQDIKKNIERPPQKWV
jgi:ABC-type nickel/cobalt efflux system permease component RcnA